METMVAIAYLSARKRTTYNSNVARLRLQKSDRLSVVLTPYY
ncbi:MAG: hypothetical protein WBC73_05225 [Phormidesmis sp.]